MDLTIPFDPGPLDSGACDQRERAAKAWNDCAPQVREWLCDSTDAMLNMAGIRRGLRVLDAVAGPGGRTPDVAKRVGPDGSVLAVDLSQGIAEFAGNNAPHAGLRNVETRVADGERPGVEPGSFDAGVCRLGLLFLPHPFSGLQEIHRALKPGGRACAMVFSKSEANPCIRIIMSTAIRHAGLPPHEPHQPGGLLSLGKPGLLDEMFDRAGFRDVVSARIYAPLVLPSARHYLDVIRQSAGPIRRILGTLDAAAADAAWADMERQLKAFDTAAGWEGPNEFLLTAAKR